MKDEDKRVDYVLAYTTESDKDPVKREMRESFEESLMAEGLESEHEDKAVITWKTIAIMYYDLFVSCIFVFPFTL